MTTDDDRDREHEEFIQKVFLSGLTAGTAGVFSYAAETFKAASFINGGSAAAVLALISQVIQKDTSTISLTYLKHSFVCFAFGLICSGFCAAASYLSQHAYQERLYRPSSHLQAGLPDQSAATLKRRGDIARYIAIFLMACALIASAIGFANVYLAIR